MVEYPHGETYHAHTVCSDTKGEDTVKSLPVSPGKAYPKLMPAHVHSYIDIYIYIDIDIDTQRYCNIFY